MMNCKRLELHRLRRGILSGTMLAAACMASPLLAQDGEQEDEDLSAAEASELLDLSLEDLLTLESTSVAKKRQRVEDSAAAVTIITQEDIRRSTASTIPGLLRMVPGVEVGPLANGATAVSIRGFNGRASNNLLVMVDGRSIYVSTLAGVLWDQLALPLGNIERIEIIRGAGAALWGSNAVNGVINIITKHSSDSLGGNADVRLGEREQQASLSFGGKLADDFSYRVHGLYRRDEGLVDAAGNDSADRASYVNSVGVRLDWEPSPMDAFSLSSEIIDGRNRTATRLPDTNPLNADYILGEASSDIGGFNVVARWVRQQSEDFSWSLQTTYEEIGHDELGSSRINWQQSDLDLGFHWKVNAVHDLNFGVGAREMKDDIRSSDYVMFNPKSATDRWLSAYLQDDISIIPDTLRLVVGAKVENTNFSGWEFQPNVRFFYRPMEDLALWGGVSRGVRTPSRYERSARLLVIVDQPGSPNNPTPLPLYSTLNGASTRSAHLVSYEGGVRVDIASDWSIDVAGYYTEYAHLPAVSFIGAVPIFVEGIPFPVALNTDVGVVATGATATWGGEVALAGRLTSWLNTNLSWSHFNHQLRADQVTGQPSDLLTRMNASPKNQVKANVTAEFTDEISLDLDVRYASTFFDSLVPSYVSANARLTAVPVPGFEVSLIGENLFNSRHVEFYETGYPAPIGYVPSNIALEFRSRF